MNKIINFILITKTTRLTMATSDIELRINDKIESSISATDYDIIIDQVLVEIEKFSLLHNGKRVTVEFSIDSEDLDRKTIKRQIPEDFYRFLFRAGDRIFCRITGSPGKNPEKFLYRLEANNGIKLFNSHLSFSVAKTMLLSLLTQGVIIEQIESVVTKISLEEDD